MVCFGEVCVVHLLGNCVLLCVFYFACLGPVSCVLSVAGFSGSSIIDSPFGFSNVYLLADYIT